MYDIRNHLGRVLLKKKARLIERKKAIHNLKTASSAGIIFECTGMDDFQQVKEFKKTLEDHGIRTSVVGYVDARDIPDPYLIRPGFYFFSQRELNWIFKPDTDFIREFLRKHFDLLIDLSLSPKFPLQYLLKLSRAHYKIGVKSDTEELDLMLDVGRNTPLSYLAEQIIYYLSMIKPGKKH